jgi:hypothetical protein
VNKVTKELEVVDDKKEIVASDFFSAIERMVSNPDVDVDKIQKVLDMQEQVLNRNAQVAFNADMNLAQADMPIIAKDKKNDQTRSKYSSYEAILGNAKPVYTKHGFSVMFYEEDAPKENEIRICADIMHKGGHTSKRHTDIPIDDKGIKGSVNKTNTHAKGSSISYGRSYLIKMVFNISTGDDDDGNGASGLPTVSEKQISTITDMINGKGVDEKTFLEFMKVGSVESILRKNYHHAIGVLSEAKGKS